MLYNIGAPRLTGNKGGIEGRSILDQIANAALSFFDVLQSFDNASKIKFVRDTVNHYAKDMDKSPSPVIKA